MGVIAQQKRFQFLLRSLCSCDLDQAFECKVSCAEIEKGKTRAPKQKYHYAVFGND